MTDKRWLKKLWDQYAGIFHIVAFFILCVFMTGSYWHKWQAQGAELDQHELRLAHLEYESTQVIQRLDDIMMYLNVPRRESK